MLNQRANKIAARALAASFALVGTIVGASQGIAMDRDPYVWGSGYTRSFTNHTAVHNSLSKLPDLLPQEREKSTKLSNSYTEHTKKNNKIIEEYLTLMHEAFEKKDLITAEFYQAEIHKLYDSNDDKFISTESAMNLNKQKCNREVAKIEEDIDSEFQKGSDKLNQFSSKVKKKMQEETDATNRDINERNRRLQENDRQFKQEMAQKEETLNREQREFDKKLKKQKEDHKQDMASKYAELDKKKPDLKKQKKVASNTYSSPYSSTYTPYSSPYSSSYSSFGKR